MASSAAPDPFRAPRPGGLGQGLGLSMLSHALLVGALALGMWWRREEPVGTTAELWAAVPEAAAPRGDTPPAPAPAPQPAPAPEPPAPPPPPPQPEPPREAEIVEQAPPPKPAPAPPPPKPVERPVGRPIERPVERPVPRPDRSAETARELAAQREANLERLMREAGSTAPSANPGAAAREAGPSATYAGLIKAKVKPNIIFPPGLAGNPQAEVEVRAAPDGTILSRRLVRPSGTAAWDEAVLRAIDRTAVLPRDVDGRVPSTMILSFRPQD